VVDEGTIERVDIVGESPITTLSGAGIGTTDEELVDLFGEQLERVDLGAGREDVIFVPSDENDQEFRVVFTMNDGVVETMRSGRVPLVLEADPCA
jgi:ethanolamine utilization protein EutA (predicted chaperonin)